MVKTMLNLGALPMWSLPSHRSCKEALIVTSPNLTEDRKGAQKSQMTGPRSHRSIMAELRLGLGGPCCSHILLAPSRNVHFLSHMTVQAPAVLFSKKSTAVLFSHFKL
jgi:hypothetical protein